MLKKSAILAGVCLGFIAALVLSYTPSAQASRNSSGTYSLPAGNPVTTGTTITSTWANSTLGDLSTEMTSSLDRNGKGGMLASLRLPNGTSSAPSLAWTSETNSGLFRNAAGDIRMVVGTSNVERWSSTGVTFPLLSTMTGAATAQAGVTVTQSTTNGNAVTGTGNGTGSGGYFVGGSSNGYGLSSFGTGTGRGLIAYGGSSGGEGGAFVAQGGNSPGLSSVGGGSGSGGTFSAGLTSDAGTRYDALVLTNGDIKLDGVANVANNTSIKNRLTPSNIIKAAGSVSNAGGTATVDWGFNVASVSHPSASILRVTFAQAFVDANYAVTYGLDQYAGWTRVSARNASYVEFQAYDSAGALQATWPTTPILMFQAVGAQ